MKIQGKQLADTLRSEDNPFSKIHVQELINGRLTFKAKNAESSSMSIGQPVYVSGISGDVPEVSLADADGSGTMPAAGLTMTAANAGAEVNIVTFGNLGGLNTAALGSGIVGQAVYVNTTSGTLTVSPPTGSSAKLQNIGTIIREHSSSGIIRVGGAGRSAATPNLDQGRFFLGNASNQSAVSAYTLPIADGSANQVLKTDGNGAVTFGDTTSSPELTVVEVASSTTSVSATPSNFYVIATTSGNTTNVTLPQLPSSYSVGDRLKIFHHGDGVLRIRENSTGTVLDPNDASTLNQTERTINPRSIVEIVLTGSSGTPNRYEYSIAPQIEFEPDSDNQVLYYDATNLSMKPLGYTFPTADGSANQVLKTNGSGALSFTTISSGISEVVEDTTPQLGGNLDLNGNDLITTSNADLDLAPNGTGVVVVKGNNNSGAIKLNCEFNSHGVTIQGPAHSANATYTLTLPVDDGDADQVLKTDGSGVLSWVDQAGGGGGGPTYSAITANTTAQADYHYSCTGTITLTLPTSGISAGAQVRVKNMGTGTITIDPQTRTIDGSSDDYLVTVQYSSLSLISTGTNWEII